MNDSTHAGIRVLIAHPGAELYGSDLVMLESARALVTAGMHVTVTVPRLGPLVTELERAGARVALCRTPVLRKNVLRPTGALRFAGATMLGVAAGIALIRRLHPDVVYVNTVTIPLWPVLARLKRIPVVAHIHEAENAAAAIVKRLLAAPLLLADVVVSNSEHCVAVVSATFPVLRARALVIRNPIAWPDQPAPARANLEGGLRVVYIGRLSERKGVDTAVRAIAELRRSGCAAELDIVGSVFPGYEWYLEGLHNLVSLLQLENEVHFHGYQASIWPYLAQSDVLVVPSRLEEGFGDTAVEAILSARPIVVSDTSGLREAADGYASAQRVDPNQLAAWTSALERVRVDWGSYRDGARSDQHLARARHSRSGYGTAIVDVIERTTRGPSPAAGLNQNEQTTRARRVRRKFAST